jgi:hypothetical protein
VAQARAGKKENIASDVTIEREREMSALASRSLSWGQSTFLPAQHHSGCSRGAQCYQLLAATKGEGSVIFRGHSWLNRAACETVQCSCAHTNRILVPVQCQQQHSLLLFGLCQ